MDDLTQLLSLLGPPSQTHVQQPPSPSLPQPSFQLPTTPPPAPPKKKAAKPTTRRAAAPPGGKDYWAVGRDPLPVDEHMLTILKSVDARRVTCIQGETGCGKSSAIPLAIVRRAEALGEEVSVVVTQPRRLAARALARRVADQLGEEVGATCGYAVGQERSSGPGTKLLFVTTGWLLQMLAHNPQALSHLSHIILDEAHERSTDADFLSLVLRRTLVAPEVPHLAETKLVVMSATLQSDLFSDYFSAPGEPKVPPPIFVGARRFPVEVVFLDELESKMGIKAPHVLRTAAGVCNSWEPPNKGRGAGAGKLRVTSKLADLAASLFVQVASPGHCVLCFLPGMGEIEEVLEAHERLARLDRRARDMHVHVLHSLVPPELQDEAMALKPGGFKVVLSTNVAESSITLPDVTHVVDFCLARGVEYDDTRRVSAMVLRRASQASLMQRAGRAGRVMPGTVVRLIPSRGFSHLEPFDAPEMLCSPLESTVLTAKLLLAALGPVGELLAGALQPPPADRVAGSLESLHGLGALTGADELSEVTPMGVVASGLPFDIRISRMLVVAAGAAEGSLLAAALSSQDPFTMPSIAFSKDPKDFQEQVRRSTSARLRHDAGLYCEPLAVRSAFLEYLAGPRHQAWGHERGIVVRRMKAVGEMVRACADKLPKACQRAGVVMDPRDAAMLKWLGRYARNRDEGGDSAAPSASGAGAPAPSLEAGGRMVEVYVRGEAAARRPAGGGGGGGHGQSNGYDDEYAGTGGGAEFRTSMAAASPDALRALVVLACPDVLLAGRPKEVKQRQTQQLKSKGVDPARSIKLSKLPMGCDLDRPERIQELVDHATWAGAVGRAVWLGSGSALVELSPALPPAPAGPYNGAPAGGAGEAASFAAPLTPFLPGDIPSAAKLLAAFRAGKRDDLKLLNPGWTRPPGHPDGDLPNDFAVGGPEVAGQIFWGGVGDRLSGLTLHCSWRGPLGTCTSSAPVTHFAVAASVISFGDTLGIAAQTTLLPGTSVESMLTLIALRPGAPSLQLLADPEVRHIAAARLGGSVLLDFTACSGAHLTRDDLNAVDAVRVELSDIATGGLSGRQASASGSPLDRLHRLAVAVASRPPAKVPPRANWIMLPLLAPRGGVFAPYNITGASFTRPPSAPPPPRVMGGGGGGGNGKGKGGGGGGGGGGGAKGKRPMSGKQVKKQAQAADDMARLQVVRAEREAAARKREEKKRG